MTFGGSFIQSEHTAAHMGEYRQIFNRGLSHLCPKIFDSSPKNCYLTWPNSIMLSTKWNSSISLIALCYLVKFTLLLIALHCKLLYSTKKFTSCKYELHKRSFIVRSFSVQLFNWLVYITYCLPYSYHVRLSSDIKHYLTWLDLIILDRFLLISCLYIQNVFLYCICIVRACVIGGRAILCGSSGKTISCAGNQASLEESPSFGSWPVKSGNPTSFSSTS